MTTINMLGVTLSGVVGSGKFAGGQSIGTWMPVFSFASPGDLSVSYATQVGHYSRIGAIVNINFTLTCTPTYTTASSSAIVNGVPFANHSGMGSNAWGPASLSTADTWIANKKMLVISLGGSSSTIGTITTGSGLSAAGLTTTQIVSGTQFTLIGSITYMT